MADNDTWEGALAGLESDLAARRAVTYEPDPAGRYVAVSIRDRCPPRPRRPIELLRHGRFAYDLTRRVLPEELPLEGRLSVYDLEHGHRVQGPWPRVTAGPVRWNAAGDALAGLRRDRGGRLTPWAARVPDATCTPFDGVAVSHSLLGLRGAAGTAVDWLADGRIVATRDAAKERSASDTVFDSADVLWPEPVLRSLFLAARADVVVLDPATGGCQPLASPRVVVCLAVAPDGRHALVGAVEDQDALYQLLAYDLLHYRVYDVWAGEPVWDLGVLCRDSLRWASGPAAGAADLGLDAVDASGPEPVLAFCDDDGEQTRFWSAPRPGVDPTLIGETAGGVAAWLPLDAGSVVLVTQEAPHRVELLTPGPAGRSAYELAGPVVGLHAMAGPEGKTITVTVRRASDGGSGDHVLRIAASGRLEQADCDGWARQRMIGPTSSGWLCQAHDEEHVRLRHVTHGAVRVVHEARVAPPCGSVRLVHGELGDSSSYQLYLPDPPPVSSGIPLVVWLSPVRALGHVRRVGGHPPATERPRLAPGTPEWTYLPRCAVASLTCPLPWDGPDTFARISDRLWAAVADLVAELSAIGGIDTQRMVLGGHSFGAAAAAVLLARPIDVFRCAVLRSGAYNRSLTPGGFQHEHRTLWQARDVYDGFTVAYAADRIRTPVLLMQGTADTNTATTVEQAHAFYDALRVAGGQARLVLVHNEGHIFHTKEGILAAAREELTWIHRWTGAPAPATYRDDSLSTPARRRSTLEEVQ